MCLIMSKADFTILQFEIGMPFQKKRWHFPIYTYISYIYIYIYVYIYIHIYIWSSLACTIIIGKGYFVVYQTNLFKQWQTAKFMNKPTEPSTVKWCIHLYKQ